MAIVIHEERCKGCGYCVETCKKGALSFSEKMNAQGIVYVQVDEEMCWMRYVLYHMSGHCIRDQLKGGAGFGKENFNEG